jgi:hypothetical protein
MRTGWPMEYMKDTLLPYKGISKRDLIVFPHRIAPEKQVNIFRDLAKNLPEYDFVVCQDQSLTKTEYHNILAQAKIVFSASLQETLGIGCYEGALVDALPMVPDRLSYKEMYSDGFKYPSHWTEDWACYINFKDHLLNHIRVTMTHYESRLPELEVLKNNLNTNFFSAKALLDQLQ